jgi:hypothetical protein
MKEIALYIAMGLFLSGGAFVIYKVRNELNPENTIKFISNDSIKLTEESTNKSKSILLTIIGGVISITIGGIILFEIDT